MNLTSTQTRQAYLTAVSKTEDIYSNVTPLVHRQIDIKARALRAENARRVARANQLRVA